MSFTEKPCTFALIAAICVIYLCCLENYMRDPESIKVLKYENCKN